jgi:hypothetical protein
MPSSEVDEAHWGKNLPFATRLDRVKGLPNPAECQRATDLFLKTQWLLERGGGIVLATGTPIANTIAESWTMARYLMGDKLEELGLHHFDAWAKLFADTVVTLEQTVTGAYRPTARFSRFKTCQSGCNCSNSEPTCAWARSYLSSNASSRGWSAATHRASGFIARPPPRPSCTSSWSVWRSGSSTSVRRSKAPTTC